MPVKKTNWRNLRQFPIKVVVEKKAAFAPLPIFVSLFSGFCFFSRFGLSDFGVLLALVKRNSSRCISWIERRLVVAKAALQNATRDKDGKFKEGGVRAASRELGIDRDDARRATKVASLPEEAKQAARERTSTQEGSQILRTLPLIGLPQRRRHQPGAGWLANI